MCSSPSSPSVVPADNETVTVYLVVDDLGKLGCCWRETNTETTDLETVITDLLEGQYWNPVRVVSFNTAEGWARDVSVDAADEIRRRCDLQMRELPTSLQEFVERHERSTESQQYRLA